VGKRIRACPIFLGGAESGENMRKTTKQQYSEMSPTSDPASASRSQQRIARPKLAHGRKRKPTLISPPIVETDFAELEDGSLVEMIEDPDNPSRTSFAVFNNAEVCFTDQIESGNQILRPIPRESEIVRHFQLPRGVQPYKSLGSLLRRMNDDILSRCLDLEDDYTFLLACFAVSTWFIDSGHLPIAPYVALVGLPGSGKSTVLKILRLLCRRSLLTADISSAAFYHACERLTPTLLIDETATAGQTRQLFHLLRTGTSRDVVALRKGQSFSAYAAKAVAWNALPNDSALNSRCIVIPLHETKRPDLARPGDPEIIAAANDIQMQLLQYRFEKLRTLRPTKVPGDEGLHARARDLYEALGLALEENTECCKWLLRCCEDQQRANREPLPPKEAAVLQTLYKAIHQTSPNYEIYQIVLLTSMVNADLERTGARFRLTPRGVGEALSSLGITNRTRTNRGWFVWIDRKEQKRIHKLIESYGLDSESYLPSEAICKICELCDPKKDVRNYNTEPLSKAEMQDGNLAEEKTGQPNTETP
jgi:hypothetical protein